MVRVIGVVTFKNLFAGIGGFHQAMKNLGGKCVLASEIEPSAKAGKQMGFKDPTKGTLFLKIKRILLAKTPRFIVLENVRNLLTHDHHNTWNVIKKELDEAGYNFKAIVMSPLLHLKWTTDYDDIYEELKVQSKDHLIHQPPVKK